MISGLDGSCLFFAMKSAKTCALMAPRGSYHIAYSDNSTDHVIIRPAKSGLDRIRAIG